MNSTQRRNQRHKVDQGYVKSPPRCVNCAHYVPPVYAVPATSAHPAIPYEPSRCGQGGFAVEPHAICALWIRSEGPSPA